jgi:NTP pyrophosphatase (non-canonical NTP hydrolase)
MRRKPATNAEAERLYLLIEECAEVQQAASKVLRHGWNAYNPLAAFGPSNQQALEKEIGQLKNAIDLLQNSGDVKEKVINMHRRNKRASIWRWLHFQAPPAEGGREKWLRIQDELSQGPPLPGEPDE